MIYKSERIKQAKRIQEVEVRDKQAIQHRVSRISTELRRELGIVGSLPEKARWCIKHAAEFIEKTDQADNIRKIIRQWYKQCPEAQRYVYTDKAQRFWYYLRDEQLNAEDALVMEAYKVVATHFVGRIDLQAKAFKGKGGLLLGKLETWLGNAGNEITDVLIDYFVAVFTAMKKFKPALIHNPSSALGDYGYSTFMDTIDIEYGGKKGYFLPTKQELRHSQKVNSNLTWLTELRQSALLNGRLDLYDKLGSCGLHTTELKSIITSLEEV